MRALFIERMEPQSNCYLLMPAIDPGTALNKLPTANGNPPRNVSSKAVSAGCVIDVCVAHVHSGATFLFGRKSRMLPSGLNHVAIFSTSL
jgi:hypothetical protein